MPLIDRDYAGKERQRIVNLIADIAADELWTALRDRDGTVDATGDARSVFQEVPQGYLDVLRGPALFRRFEVRVTGGGDHSIQTIGPIYDHDVRLVIRVGYPVPGGALMPFPGSGPRVDEVATADMVRIRQKVQDPSNRQAGLTGPVYSGLPPAARRALVRCDPWAKVIDEPPGRGARQVWEMPVRSWIRATLEAA